MSTTRGQFVYPLRAKGFSIKRFMLIYLLTFSVWMLLVSSLKTQEIIFGLWVALMASVLSQHRLAILDGVKFSLLMPLHIVHFIGVFLWALIVANLDLARRVLSPSLPIDPAVVEIETTLQSPLGKLLLANCITLTPGTLTLDVIDNRLLVHWIDCAAGKDIQCATQAISAKFERRLLTFLW